MLEKTLSKLGFSPSEIKIYSHLLHKGCSYPNKISSDTKINRTNVYEALDRLVRKGVVSFVLKNNMKWFEAENPDNLLSLIKEKEEELSETKKELKKSLNSIKIDSNNPSLEAKIFTGKKGLRMLFEEMLESRNEIMILASVLQLSKFFGPYFELWHKERINLGIKQRSIFAKQFKSQLKKRKLLRYKFVDNRYINPTTTIIFGNSVLLIQWSNEPLAIKIENKDIVESHKNYFEMLWKS